MIIDRIEKADVLRNSKKLVPEGVGYYKWYSTKDDLITLLEKLNLQFSSIPTSQWDIENGLYCIYIGIAKKSLNNRIVDWHIKQHHSLALIKSGHLSTLKASLSSILFRNQAEEVGTNTFMKGLTVHYFYYDHLDPELDESGETVEELETELINDGHLKILNGKKNYNIYKPSLLTKLRREGKQNGIKTLS